MTSSTSVKTVAFAVLVVFGAETNLAKLDSANPKEVDRSLPAEDQLTVGGGCFWCLEAIFSRLKGVSSVESGYSGGVEPNPTYEQVCSGRTGHAEVVQIRFDGRIISLKQLLEVFFAVHDPTTLNRQGPDVGAQYRSTVFYRTPVQKATIEEVIRELTAAGVWERPIVTEVVPFKVFYRAEEYHQDYFLLHPDQG
jgi:peptide-methionine (S)-S-oxide reductase